MRGAAREGRDGGGWNLRMLRGARTERAIARIAALAATVSLVTAPLSAEPAGNGWHLVGSGAGAGSMDAALGVADHAVGDQQVTGEIKVA